MNKFLSILICVFLLLSAVACSPTSKEQPPKTDEKDNTLYDDIISQYTSLLKAKYNGEELSLPRTDGMSEREAAIAEALYGIVSTLNDKKSAENMGYGYKDLDGNGIPELILLTRYTSVRAIFTISDNQPILLEANYEKASSFSFATKNRFFMRRGSSSGNIEEVTYYTCRVSGDKMVYDSIYGKVYETGVGVTQIFQIADRKRISIDENSFNELYREHEKSVLPEYMTTAKLLAPRIHFPLKENRTDEKRPVADFSSYAAILKTYNKISTCIDKFDSATWTSGGYDDLFDFPSDLSFEYYTRLLYAAYHGSYDIGYDEIDLNGDGQSELVLMTENYRIKAIFTQTNGTPVLLDAFGYENCWLDEKGLIHVDNEQYYELEYSLYELTKNSEYNLVYSILVANNGNRYLTKDGKTEQITFEQSMELYYDDYCRYSEPFAPYEYTRNVSGLTYTPLNETTEDLISSATDKIWHKYADLKKSSDKDLAHSNTYVTFKSTSERQLAVTLKYEFTYYYPDPDRENYLLDNTTESTVEINARKENGVLVFDENTLKGKIEFGHNYLWIIIDESTDERFPVGNHCYEQYSPDEYVKAK